MFKLSLLLAALLLFSKTFSQIPLEKALIEKVNSAKDYDTKVQALGELAEFYTIYRADKKADSVLEIQLSVAELSTNKSLITAALFGNSLTTLSSWSGKETFEKALSFIQKGLEYAKAANLKDLEAVAYLRKANLYRKRKLYDQASQHILLAFPVLESSKNDSLKTELYLELGNILLAKGDIAAAYTNFNNAFDIAYKEKNVELLSSVYHHFADLYSSLGNEDQAKKSLLESVQLNTKKSNAVGLVTDFIDLFRLSSAPEYLNQASRIADSINSIRYKLFCKKLRFHFLAIEKKDAAEAVRYLNSNPDLYQSYVYQGMLNYYIGTVYQYSGQPDSAIHYYLREEPQMVQAYDPSVQSGFFMELAQCYAAVNAPQKAIDYFEKAYELTKSDSANNENIYLTSELSKLYAQSNNYEKAFAYSQLNIGYNHLLNNTAAQREVALLAFEREKNRHERDLEETLATEQKRREAQYLGISIATLFLFSVLIVFGMFPVSKLAVRMLNFVAFICLFEFIILLIDNWLGEITHHAPLQMWLAKIVVIAILLPLHHALEHLTIKFLSSQKLMKFRQHFSIKKLWHPSKRKVRKIEEDLEQSTLI